jgi:hypothetical protein
VAPGKALLLGVAQDQDGADEEHAHPIGKRKLLIYKAEIESLALLLALRGLKHINECERGWTRCSLPLKVRDPEGAMGACGRSWRRRHGVAARVSLGMCGLQQGLDERSSSLTMGWICLGSHAAVGWSRSGTVRLEANRPGANIKGTGGASLRRLSAVGPLRQAQGG